MSKLTLYWNTVRYLKPSQVYYRLRKMLRMSCSLGLLPQETNKSISTIRTVPELDFDPVFLARFSVEDLIAGRVTLLHESEVFQWDSSWDFPERSPLWNYNLHYFEYLFPIVKAYKDSGNTCYLDKFKQVILAWIRQNAKGTGAGWDPYPTALRLTNWLSLYMYLAREINNDADFLEAFERSIREQYDHLARHLEKDLLGNHYFEDLKALVLCGLFFGDDETLQKALIEFHQQCREQILLDGMHFELSPMYHKIILEDVLRVAFALREAGKADAEIEGYIQPMLDVAYSLEEGLERIPLFNDCGNNVAKGLDALCLAAKVHFNIEPHYKAQMPDSGYYIFKQSGWKLIVDAGQPGPKYIPGHAHCDAMSFELFKDGRPVLVNCGTYAYQCEERTFFRSTAAHNTVMVDGVEQSQCWGAFRMGKRSSTLVLEVDDHHIVMEMTDQMGRRVTRDIRLEADMLEVTDNCTSGSLDSFIHGDVEHVSVLCGEASGGEAVYAPEFGQVRKIGTKRVTGNGQLKYCAAVGRMANKREVGI